MKPKLIFPILTAAMVIIIWGHSFMPGELSGNESGAVVDFLRELFHFTGDIDTAVRKCAHFFEYMALGILFSIDFYLYTGSPLQPATFVPGLFVPQTDETIQLFTPDRAGSLLDVWLDFTGYVTGVIFCTVIYKVVCKKHKAS